ncbi:hypothetical protein Hdeb2414_s0018g00515301 [Helianthus debilis subsp. tardiflorus]
MLQCCCRLLEGARLSLVNMIINKTLAGIVTGGMRKGLTGAIKIRIRNGIQGDRKRRRISYRNPWLLTLELVKAWKAQLVQAGMFIRKTSQVIKSFTTNDEVVTGIESRIFVWTFLPVEKREAI